MSLFWFVYVVLCLSLVAKFGVIRLAITVALTGSIIVWLVWAGSWKAYKDQNWYCKIFTILGWIIILIGCSIIPIYNVHQEHKQEEVLEITELSNVIKITYVHNVPETTRRMWNGKFFISKTDEPYTWEEVTYQCYSETGELLNTFSSEEVEIKENKKMYIETKYKDSWWLNHVSDLLDVESEIDFIKGECVKEHKTYSYSRVEVQKTLYLNLDTLKKQTIYVNK